MECLRTIADIITALAAIGAFLIARAGLNTWKDQLKAQTYLDLARRLLRQVYAVRDSIRLLRHPFMSGAEMEAARHAEKAPGITSDGEVDPVDAGYRQRWSRVRKALSDMDVEILEAEVLWGAEAKKSMQPLRQCGTELYAHLDLYLRYRKDDRPSTESVLGKAEKVVYQSSAEDGFAKQLDDAVAIAEAFIRPKLH